jgi:pentatricopeptide repeat protein
MSYQPIENYGVIGDMNTIALVNLNGSIDFMCFPDFDSPTIFAALLDHEKGGFFKICPQFPDVKHKQMYLPDTNVLITRFLASDGMAEIIDFMPVEGIYQQNALIRRVKSIRGNPKFLMHCAPRFNYARSHHKVVNLVDSVLFVSKEQEGIGLRLQSTIPLKIENGDASATFQLNPGQSADFILTRIGEPILKDHIDEKVSQSLFNTIHYWRRWLSHCLYQGRWQNEVHRSALVLKLLISKKFGSIVAAPTFGLPEEVGGGKNWDYRYLWIRDAAFTFYALIRLGFTREATDFVRWIETRCPDLRHPGQLCLMYAINGNKQLEEKILDHFEGYKKSAPVRIGNAAYMQLQLDIYGELLDSLYLYNKYGEPISHDLWVSLQGHIDWLCDKWEFPDEGIWEVREGRQEFLYSRLMVWVAFDRMIRIGMQRSFPLPRRWFQERDKIYIQIFNEFWNEERKTFVQFKGSKRVDAALLLMPLKRFVGAKDPRWLSTLACIEKDLVSDSLVYRYRPQKEDTLFDEGTFSLCSFWYVECLSRSGQLEKARYYFEKMLGYSNHLGLYAEQLGLKGEHLGNFPQAFTHLGLISAAHNLNENLNNPRNKSLYGD